LTRKEEGQAVVLVEFVEFEVEGQVVLSCDKEVLSPELRSELGVESELDAPESDESEGLLDEEGSVSVSAAAVEG
jgi:hypothetical protein